MVVPRRDLIAQLIDVRRREEVLRNKNRELKAANKKLREELRYCNESQLKKRLNHALAELAEKSQRGMLSNEEWQLIREFRGQC